MEYSAKFVYNHILAVFVAHFFAQAISERF